MSDLEKLVTEASLLRFAADDAPNVKFDSGTNPHLSINTRMKLVIHENLIQESGMKFL